ncbi:MAG: hypothetical protein HZA93_13255 [Verrucomicrobia bacterium]|nr:hypothetical protein [Verrucomicrobiota bacterium]
MKFPRPLPFRQAVTAAQARTLLPTNMRTAEFAQLVADGHAAVLERARFSAGVRSVQHLDVIDSGINDLVAGVTDLATQRLAVKNFLRGTGYMAPESERGTLTDLASDVRINLQLSVGVQQAQGYGWWKQGQQADILDAFPAQEFLRVEDRMVPRQDWPQRWNAARSATVTDGATDSSSGRMVALKNHPIWVALSRFGTPYEPFDYNSGMGVEDVARKDAMNLGLLGRDTQIFPQDRPFNEDLQATVDVRADRLRQLLQETGLGRFDRQGVFIYTREGGN